MRELNAGHIEIAVARSFSYRQNIIVPNISWGWGLRYEVDLVIVSPSKYAWEIEIKTSKQDIKNDLKKRHFHDSNKFKRFSYAVPWYLEDCEYLKRDCGLISVDKNLICKTIRPPRLNKYAQKLTDKEIVKLLSLGCLRIWTLKEIINPVLK